MVVPLTFCLLLLSSVLAHDLGYDSPPEPAGAQLTKIPDIGKTTSSENVGEEKVSPENSLEEPIVAPTRDFPCPITYHFEIVSKFLDALLELTTYTLNSKDVVEALDILKKSLQKSPQSSEKDILRLKSETVEAKLKAKLRSSISDKKPIFLKASFPGMDQPYCREKFRDLLQIAYTTYETSEPDCWLDDYDSYSSPLEPDSERDLAFNPYHKQTYPLDASGIPHKHNCFLPQHLPNSMNVEKVWAMHKNPNPYENKYIQNNIQREPHTHDNILDYIKTKERPDEYPSPKFTDVTNSLIDFASNSDAIDEFNSPNSVIPLNPDRPNTIPSNANIDKKSPQEIRSDNKPSDIFMKLPKANPKENDDDNNSKYNILDQETLNASDNAPNLSASEELVTPLNLPHDDKQSNNDDIKHSVKYNSKPESDSQLTDNIDYSVLLSQLGFGDIPSKLTSPKHDVFGHNININQLARPMNIISYGPDYNTNILHSQQRFENNIPAKPENRLNEYGIPIEYDKVTIKHNIGPYPLDLTSSNKDFKNNLNPNAIPVGSNTISSDLHHILSMTNLLTLSQSNINGPGFIELTYVLRRSKPIIYYPTYYVKYRVPYTTFVKGYRDLISKPQLRQASKSFQDLLTESKVTEISPGLEGYKKNELMKLVFDEGALVGAKILKEKNDDLNEQLGIIQKLNIDTDPYDILALANTTLEKPSIKSEVGKEQFALSSMNKIPIYDVQNRYISAVPQQTIVSPVISKVPLYYTGHQNFLLNPYRLRRPGMQNTSMNQYLLKKLVTQSTLNPQFYKGPVTHNSFFNRHLFGKTPVNRSLFPSVLPSAFMIPRLPARRIPFRSPRVYGR